MSDMLNRCDCDFCQETISRVANALWREQITLKHIADELEKSYLIVFDEEEPEMRLLIDKLRAIE